jgi:hypothetical protein
VSGVSCIPGKLFACMESVWIQVHHRSLDAQYEHTNISDSVDRGDLNPELEAWLPRGPRFCLPP